jgi:hypothetical protein
MFSDITAFITVSFQTHTIVLIFVKMSVTYSHVAVYILVTDVINVTWTAT